MSVLTGVMMILNFDRRYKDAAKTGLAAGVDNSTVQINIFT